MRARKRKLYLDTSIFGFALQRIDLARRSEANRLLRQIRDGEFLAGYSFVTEAEIDAAPPAIAQRLRRLITNAGLRRVRVRSRSQAHDLAERYCQARAIPREYFDDALHVAIATLWRADALVSYNFTHLVRLDTMIQVNTINRDEGLAELHLCQPSEVIRW
jgi:hypothetical protein